MEKEDRPPGDKHIQFKCASFPWPVLLLCAPRRQRARIHGALM